MEVLYCYGDFCPISHGLKSSAGTLNSTLRNLQQILPRVLLAPCSQEGTMAGALFKLSSIVGAHDTCVLDAAMGATPQARILVHSLAILLTRGSPITADIRYPTSNIMCDIALDCVDAGCGECCDHQSIKHLEALSFQDLSQMEIFPEPPYSQRLFVARMPADLCRAGIDTPHAIL